MFPALSRPVYSPIGAKMPARVRADGGLLPCTSPFGKKAARLIRGLLARPVLIFALALLVYPTSLAAQESFTLLSPGSLSPVLNASIPVDSACGPSSLQRATRPMGAAPRVISTTAVSLGDPLEGAPVREKDSSPPRTSYRLLIGSAVALGVVAGSALHSFTETPHVPYHFTSEGFFGEETHAGAGRTRHRISWTSPSSARNSPMPTSGLGSLG